MLEALKQALEGLSSPRGARRGCVGAGWSGDCEGI